MAPDELEAIGHEGPIPDGRGATVFRGAFLLLSEPYGAMADGGDALGTPGYTWLSRLCHPDGVSLHVGLPPLFGTHRGPNSPTKTPKIETSLDRPRPTRGVKRRRKPGNPGKRW